MEKKKNLSLRTQWDPKSIFYLIFDLSYRANQAICSCDGGHFTTSEEKEGSGWRPQRCHISQHVFAHSKFFKPKKNPMTL